MNVHRLFTTILKIFNKNSGHKDLHFFSLKISIDWDQYFLYYYPYIFQHWDIFSLKFFLNLIKGIMFLNVWLSEGIKYCFNLQNLFKFLLYEKE